MKRIREKDKSSSKVFQFDRYERDREREREKFGSLTVKQVATMAEKKPDFAKFFH